ncbi:HAUS augmin-like complex subunit 7 [Polyodon spathula]|uniref:HAUS augmin-like complex subunit 7 n=1 Tax=Polyodon spathula TaxID=7913 RepID=UPI001B7DE0F3|nr:HAUS augmin-like complex subunit 7 [Polyodon spathula]
MAGSLKERELSVKIYKKLQALGCPSVEGLFLREADDMKELLCTPSIHRLDILQWICTSICPPMTKHFSGLKGPQPDTQIKELVQFCHEMLLCRQDDFDLIKGISSPQRQLALLEQLVDVIPRDEREAGEPLIEQVCRNEALLKELFSSPHLQTMLQPTCHPWPVEIRELLSRRGAAGHGSNTASKKSRNLPSKQREDSLKEVTESLQKTNTALEEIHKECVFLHSDPQSSGSSSTPLSSPALRLAIVDLSQLMTAFSQLYDSDFREYCKRAAPQLNESAQAFSTAHSLLAACTKELQALNQLSLTSLALTSTVEGQQQCKQFWSRGHMHSLPAKIDELKRRYKDFLCIYQRSREHVREESAGEKMLQEGVMGRGECAGGSP